MTDGCRNAAELADAILEGYAFGFIKFIFHHMIKTIDVCIKKRDAMIVQSKIVI